MVAEAGVEVVDSAAADLVVVVVDLAEAVLLLLGESHEAYRYKTN